MRYVEVGGGGGMGGDGITRYWKKGDGIRKGMDGWDGIERG